MSSLFIYFSFAGADISPVSCNIHIARYLGPGSDNFRFSANNQMTWFGREGDHMRLVNLGNK